MKALPAKHGLPSASSRNQMSDRMGSPPAVEDQARLLEDALVLVRQQTHLMRKCLETPGKLMDALKCRYDARSSYCVQFLEDDIADCKPNS